VTPIPDRPTPPAGRLVPRWGSVAHPRRDGAWPSTTSRFADPRPAASRTAALRTAALRPATLHPAAPQTSDPRPAAPRLIAPWAGGAVMVGGLAFLIGRLAVGGLPFAVPLLAVGYLALTGAALAVGERHTDRAHGSPLGWAVPLMVGLVGVTGAAVVGGPVADRRVGGVAVGLALVAAVAEEALFRRVLYDRLLRFGVVMAVVGSAVVFALVHLPAYGLAAMPVDLGAALLLGWQRYASGRWTVPAVTHAVANLLAVT
jgi:membrane protease YdiL (CAAX protease family)